MSKRAAAAARTRERIVDATRDLHGEQGIAATSWEDIAARAGVGVGTVYRHFPSLDELIPACGEITMRAIGRAMSHSSSASSGHTIRRRPSGSTSGGRLSMAENSIRSRGCMAVLDVS